MPGTLRPRVVRLIVFSYLTLVYHCARVGAASMSVRIALAPFTSLVIQWSKTSNALPIGVYANVTDASFGKSSQPLCNGRTMDDWVPYVSLAPCLHLLIGY